MQVINFYLKDLSGRVLKIDAACAAPSQASLWAVSVMRTDGGANEAHTPPLPPNPPSS